MMIRSWSLLKPHPQGYRSSELREMHSCAGGSHFLEASTPIKTVACSTMFYQLPSGKSTITMEICHWDFLSFPMKHGGSFHSFWKFMRFPMKHGGFLHFCKRWPRGYIPMSPHLRNRKELDEEQRANPNLLAYPQSLGVAALKNGFQVEHII